MKGERFDAGDDLLAGVIWYKDVSHNVLSNFLYVLLERHFRQGPDAVPAIAGPNPAIHGFKQVLCHNIVKVPFTFWQVRGQVS